MHTNADTYADTHVHADKRVRQTHVFVPEILRDCVLRDEEGFVERGKVTVAAGYAGWTRLLAILDYLKTRSFSVTLRALST